MYKLGKGGTLKSQKSYTNSHPLNISFLFLFLFFSAIIWIQFQTGFTNSIFILFSLFQMLRLTPSKEFISIDERQKLFHH